MIQASTEQLQVINAPIAPMSVIACAGSGKTYTAVRRLAELRRQLGDQRSRVALLSFSNVAVDTFKCEYQNLVRGACAGIAHECVEIDTLDGFITRNVLRAHAYRTMGAKQSAFLVAGAEPFLNGFKFNTSTFPREITQMQVGIDNGAPHFFYVENDRTRRLDPAYAAGVVHRLGRIGAYTHNLGRYWCYRTLADQPGILRALARRYPHILIDEAQDVGTVHQAIIELLVDAGSQVSLIGDPSQGIYEFAGANGTFLTEYGQRAGVRSLGLTRNFRSVSQIVGLANRLSNRMDTADRGSPDATCGAFFVPYRQEEQRSIVAAFRDEVVAAGLSPERSAVLCRGRKLADRLKGNQGAPGQGIVQKLAQASILRGGKRDFFGAHKLVAACVVGLLADPPNGLTTRLTQPGRYPEDRSLHRLIWAFTRNPDSGLPEATLPGSTHWHPQLVERTRALLAEIERDQGLSVADNLGKKLAKRGLTDAPLIEDADHLLKKERLNIRVDTVHKAKGESLDAVLYLATRAHVNALIAGVDTEVGRIGYVAATRARNLLWLGVPARAVDELRPALLDSGFREIDAEESGRGE